MLIKPKWYFSLRKQCHWEIRKKITYSRIRTCVVEVL
uniref:Macaca fascicularis brain cDNA clone: QflA-20657, similar to human alanyl-tRNA synthetase like (AARSL), mRNA, RefSeq: NM_020745.1 n=1 Tax=Macaca fascicularis TaxID=9541 RepID=I7G6M4_MACFA|nr:unnamed protein product [Macaca fascicularis]